MRLVPVLALMSSALALAACAGGGGSGSAVLGASGIANGVGSCITPVDNNPNNDCQVAGGGGGGTTTPPLPDSDGDGIPDGPTGGDGDGNTGSGAGGNATGLDKGNKTIALQGFIYDTPKAPAPSALSVLTSSTSPTQAGITAEILSANKPKNLKFEIDTKSPQNTQFAVPIRMDEFRSGTRDLSWIGLGHTVGGITAPPNLVDPAGNVITFDFNDNRYETAAGKYVNYRVDFYWNQLVPYMNAKANGGAKANYREYNIKDYSTGVNRDELLQVWAWDDSYASQYQNVMGGGAPKQQAWSFGGNATTAMPTGGSATYNGRFVAAAQTTGWTKKDGSDIDPNALWRVQGKSSMNANFGTGVIDGTLTPETWTSYQSALKSDYTWYTSESGTQSANTAATPNYYYIYETSVAINGKLDAAPAGSLTPASTFSGKATLDEPYSSYTNPAYGGFFGTTAGEMTGIFNVAGAQTDPEGGSDATNDTKNGYLTINGAFNGKCTNAGGVCPP